MPDAQSQIDIIDNRFFDQRLKVPRVVCQTRTHEIAEIAIEAPPGLTFCPADNLFNVPVTLELLGPPVLRDVTVCTDIVINQGIIPARLISKSEGCTTVLVPKIEIPFEGVEICKGAAPGDFIQKHDVQISCTSISPFFTFCPHNPCACPKLFLNLKVVIDLCLIVARETIVKVNTAEPFCN